MRPEMLPADIICSTRVLHVSGISQAISPSACDTVFAAIDMAKTAGARISYDSNLRLKLWPLARARAVIMATICAVRLVPAQPRRGEGAERPGRSRSDHGLVSRARCTRGGAEMRRRRPSSCQTAGGGNESPVMW